MSQILFSGIWSVIAQFWNAVMLICGSIRNFVLIFWVLITLPDSDIELNIPVHFVYYLKADKTHIFLFLF